MQPERECFQKPSTDCKSNTIRSDLLNTNLRIEPTTSLLNVFHNLGQNLIGDVKHTNVDGKFKKCESKPGPSFVFSDETNLEVICFYLFIYLHLNKNICTNLV